MFNHFCAQDQLEGFGKSLELFLQNETFLTPVPVWLLLQAWGARGETSIPVTGEQIGRLKRERSDTTANVKHIHFWPTG